MHLAANSGATASRMEQQFSSRPGTGQSSSTLDEQVGGLPVHGFQRASPLLPVGVTLTAPAMLHHAGGLVPGTSAS